MKFNVYTVYDKKLKQFCAPFIQRADAVDRTIKQILSESSIPSADLQLIEIATWDDETCELINVDHVCTEVSDILEVIK